jgi:hypothetical protein
MPKCVYNGHVESFSNGVQFEVDNYSVVNVNNYSAVFVARHLIMFNNVDSVFVDMLYLSTVPLPCLTMSTNTELESLTCCICWWSILLLKCRLTAEWTVDKCSIDNVFVRFDIYKAVNIDMLYLSTGHLADKRPISNSENYGMQDVIDTRLNTNKWFAAALVKMNTMLIWDLVSGRLPWVRSGFFCKLPKSTSNPRKPFIRLTYF